jgi:hypothetical protein
MQIENDRDAPGRLADTETEAERITAANLLKFVIPAILGVGLFLTPVRYQGNATVVLGILIGQIQAAMGSSMKYATTAIFVSSASLTLLYTFAPDRWTDATPRLRSVLRTQPGWLALRVLGGVFSAMTLLQLGPEWVISEKTGSGRGCRRLLVAEVGTAAGDSASGRCCRAGDHAEERWPQRVGSVLFDDARRHDCRVSGAGDLPPHEHPSDPHDAAGSRAGAARRQ